MSGARIRQKFAKKRSLHGVNEHFSRIFNAIIVPRSNRAKVSGNLGDIKPVGDGVFEMREHFGPGWRMYYIQRDGILIVMLGGGDKSSQNEDIARAQSLAASLED